eukprot:jgi/Mesvir1/4064/Mv10509-RA.1
MKCWVYWLWVQNSSVCHYPVHGFDDQLHGFQIEDALLHVAAMLGHFDTVQQLVSAGAKRNAKDKRGRTPLHMASLFGHLTVVEYLLSINARLRAKDKEGCNLLFLAASAGHMQVVRYLVAIGVDKEAQDKGDVPRDRQAGPTDSPMAPSSAPPQMPQGQQQEHRQQRGQQLSDAEFRETYREQMTTAFQNMSPNERAFMFNQVPKENWINYVRRYTLANLEAAHEEEVEEDAEEEANYRGCHHNSCNNGHRNGSNRCLLCSSRTSTPRICTCNSKDCNLKASFSGMDCAKMLASRLWLRAYLKGRATCLGNNIHKCQFLAQVQNGQRRDQHNETDVVQGFKARGVVGRLCKPPKLGPGKLTSDEMQRVLELGAKEGIPLATIIDFVHNCGLAPATRKQYLGYQRMFGSLHVVNAAYKSMANFVSSQQEQFHAEGRTHPQDAMGATMTPQIKKLTDTMKRTNGTKKFGKTMCYQTGTPAQFIKPEEEKEMAIHLIEEAIRLCNTDDPMLGQMDLKNLSGFLNFQTLPTPAVMLGILAKEGKTNQYGYNEYVGALMNKDWFLCPIILLAFHLFWRMKLLQEPVLGIGYDKDSRETLDWKMRPIMRGQTHTEPWDPTTHFKMFKKALDAIGARTAHVCHEPRAMGAQRAVDRGFVA